MKNSEYNDEDDIVYKECEIKMHLLCVSPLIPKLMSFESMITETDSCEKNLK